MLCRCSSWECTNTALYDKYKLLALMDCIKCYKVVIEPKKVNIEIIELKKANFVMISYHQSSR